MASKRRIRRQSCARKRRHESRDQANVQVSRLIRGGKTRGGKVIAYACPFCGGWHVGHTGELST